MSFNSIAFVIFLLVVFTLYWSMPHKYRWLLLLVSSYCFYISCNWKYLIMIIYITLVSYFAAILLENEDEMGRRKFILTIAVLLCIGVLYWLKYFNFASESFINLFLPIGASFYTLQAVGYVVDVYSYKVKAQRHLGYYALFISFFPKLEQGPIERAGHLMPQLKTLPGFDYYQATYGLKLMAWGYLKKVVIADSLSKYTDVVFGTPYGYQGFALVLAVLFFTIQIYCDFSGYSDIAVGVAKLFGIDIMANFKSPYFSESIREFWRRWHISLSTWFRDYLYIPMGGNKVGSVRRGGNLLITFLASGLWHGADLTFVVWGVVHATAQILENIVTHKRKNKSLDRLAVFLIVSFGWIFFASATLGDAIYIIGHIFIGFRNPISYFRNGFAQLNIGKLMLVVDAVLVIILAVYDYISMKKDVISLISGKSKIVRWTVYICLALIIIIFSQKGEMAEFIYVQY